MLSALISRGGSQTTNAISLSDSMMWRQNSRMGSTDQHAVIYLQQFRGCIALNILSQGKDRTDRLVSKLTVTCGLRLRLSEWKIVRHCQRVQSQEHHTIDCQKETGAEKGSARRKRRVSTVRTTVELSNNFMGLPEHGEPSSTGHTA